MIGRLKSGDSFGSNYIIKKELPEDSCRVVGNETCSVWVLEGKIFHKIQNRLSKENISSFLKKNCKLFKNYDTNKLSTIGKMCRIATYTKGKY